MKKYLSILLIISLFWVIGCENKKTSSIRFNIPSPIIQNRNGLTNNTNLKTEAKIWLLRKGLTLSLGENDYLAATIQGGKEFTPILIENIPVGDDYRILISLSVTDSTPSTSSPKRSYLGGSEPFIIEPSKETNIKIKMRPFTLEQIEGTAGKHFTLLGLKYDNSSIPNIKTDTSFWFAYEQKSSYANDKLYVKNPNTTIRELPIAMPSPYVSVYQLMINTDNKAIITTNAGLFELNITDYYSGATKMDYTHPYGFPNNFDNKNYHSVLPSKEVYISPDFITISFAIANGNIDAFATITPSTGGSPQDFKKSITAPTGESILKAEIFKDSLLIKTDKNVYFLENVLRIEANSTDDIKNWMKKTETITQDHLFVIEGKTINDFSITKVSSTDIFLWATNQGIYYSKTLASTNDITAELKKSLTPFEGVENIHFSQIVTEKTAYNYNNSISSKSGYELKILAKDSQKGFHLLSFISYDRGNFQARYDARYLGTNQLMGNINDISPVGYDGGDFISEPATGFMFATDSGIYKLTNIVCPDSYFFD